jgi:hypothetical protein
VEAQVFGRAMHVPELLKKRGRCERGEGGKSQWPEMSQTCHAEAMLRKAPRQPSGLKLGHTELSVIPIQTLCNL